MPSQADTTVTIFHNPACSTSRKVLALIREAGIEPVVVEYLKTPYTRAHLKELLRMAGLSARELLRQKGDLFTELDLANPKWTDDQLIDHMVAHPVLVNRPIVAGPRGARLCRPIELVHELLPQP